MRCWAGYRCAARPDASLLRAELSALAGSPFADYRMPVGASTSLLLGSVGHAVAHATVPVAVERGEVPEPVRETEDRVPVVTAYQPMTLL